MIDPPDSEKEIRKGMRAGVPGRDPNNIPYRAVINQAMRNTEFGGQRWNTHKR